MIAHWVHSPAWTVAGWTMIHFLWIGSGIGLVSYVGRIALRREHPRLGYAFALASLLVLAATPGLIFQRLHRTMPDAIAMGARPTAIAIESRAVAETAIPENVADAVRPGLSSRGGRDAFRSLARHDWEAFGDSLAARAPWIWLAGTPLMLLVVGFGFVGTGRLRRHSVVVGEGWLVDRCEELRRSLRIRRRVGLALSHQVFTPVLLGVLRPMILLPPALLSGYSQDQIEMILIHELAHLRRWDALVNWMQRLIEALLFFHPVVWVVSRWVREEREHCCDEVALRHTGNAEAYAAVLASLAAVVPAPAPVTGLALARHPLVGRIRRILEWQQRTLPLSGGVWMGVSTLAVACLALVGLATQGISPVRAENQGGQVNRPSEAVSGNVLHFPKDQWVGDLCWESKPGTSWDPERVCLDYNWEYAALARGDVAVPQDRKIQLVVRLGPRPGDAERLRAQNRLAYQMQVANRVRIDPEDLSGLSGLGSNDLNWLVVSSLVTRPDADREVLGPIGRLSGLQRLSLHSTGVTDQGLQQLRGLRSLQFLELANEPFVGDAGLALLQDLPALEYLDLNTGATDAGLGHLAALPSLRWLRLRTDRPWGPGLAYLRNLRRLERLCLWGETNISDRHVQYLEGLTQLKGLTLWGVADQLTDASLASIGKLKGLEELHFILTSPKFTPAGLARLKDLRNLRKVDFSQTWSGPEGARYGDQVVRQLAVLPGLESMKGIGYLSAEGLKVVGTFRNLKCLSLALKDRQQNYQGPTGVSHLANLSALEELSFASGQSLCDADLASLQPLGRLRSLLILGSGVTDQGLATISKFGRLEQLDLMGAGVSRDGLNQLRSLRTLRELNLQLWPQAWSGAVPRGLVLDLSPLTGLEKLRLSGLPLQEADMAFLAQLSRLEELTIDASSLPGTSLRHLAALGELEYLSVRGLSRCTGGQLAQLGRLPRLRTLILGGEVPDAAVLSLTGLPSVQSLTIETGEQVRSETIAELKRRLPTMDSIHLRPPLGKARR